MKIFRLLFFVSVLIYWPVQAQSDRVEEFAPRTGQPAADVLGSFDIWGNPTFIGGITNKGPDSQSVW